MKPHPYGTVNPCRSTDSADAALDDALAVIDALGLKACLAFGTCLGFYRDGGYIDGDNDIDLVVLAEPDEQDALIDAMSQAGFGVGSTCPPIRNRHFYKYQTLVDIFWRKGINFYGELGAVEYKGRAYPVPLRIEEYLAACYADWRKPHREAAHYNDD